MLETGYPRYRRVFAISRIFLAALVLAAVFHGCSAVTPEPETRPAVPVTILFLNDLHGHLLPFKVNTPEGGEEVSGIARVATIVKQVRKENEKKNIRTLVLVAGDILQGTPLSTVYKGEPDIAALNVIGVDAMTVGNHEFDFGLDNFLKLKAAARFPFLSANIYRRESGTPVCDAGAEFELTQGVYLTVLGVTTQQLMTTTLPANVAMLEVMDSVTALKSAYEKALRSGTVLLLSHSRHQTDRRIAENYPRLCAIIGGHDQILMNPFRSVAGVPVFQAFEKGRYVGRIDLLIDPVSRKSLLVNWAYLPVTAEIFPDKDVSEIVETYNARLDEKFKAVVGHAAVFMEAERGQIRYEETNLGNWVTDIMRAHTGADIALLNSGSLRASIAKGPVTIADVFMAMPYENTLVMVDLSGRELMAVLNRSAMGSRDDEDGGFLQVSGLRFSIRDRMTENIVIGQKAMPVCPDKIYRVVITDFLASGGDGYHWFRNKVQHHTNLPLRELLVDSVRNRRSISAAVEGRITRISP